MSATPSQFEYSTFKKVPIRGRFEFENNVGFSWVRTGLKTYAAPWPTPVGRKIIHGRYPGSYTGRVQFWQGYTYTQTDGTAKVKILPPPLVYTEEGNGHSW